jgi:PST family polysaccharide transporter
VFFLGQRFNVATVGFFNRADAVKNISSKTIDKVLQRVAFPLLCKVRSNKVDNMYYNHLIMFEFLLLLLLPLTYFMFKCSEEIILLIYGNSWLQSANLLKILVLGGILIPMTSLNLTLLKSNRKTFFLLLNKLIGLSLLFVLILSGGDFSIQKILNFFMIIILIQYIISIISLLFMNEFNLKSYFKVLTYMLVVLVITSLLYDNLFHIKNTSILLSLFSNFFIVFVLFISSFFTSKKILKYKTHIHPQPK